jgi:hypothetical protein
MLHHVADPVTVAATVQEMVRVTSTQGWVVLWDHNPRNPYWPIIMRRVPQDTGVERLIPAAELVAAANGPDVSRIQVYQMGFVPDFAPRWSMPIFRTIERAIEASPLRTWLAAHNVVVVKKR